MIIYASMFIYVFIVGYVSKYFETNTNIRRNGWYENGTTRFCAILILALPVFFIGMRTNYVDTKAYINGFQALSTDLGTVISGLEESKGLGWLIYQWILKRFVSQNSQTFLMITAVIQAGAVLKLYRKYSIDYAYSILLFFLSCSFVNMMNGIRQFMALSLIIYFADYIFEKKYLKFVLVILVASMIHISALIWLPAVFIVQGKPWNMRTLLFAGLILLAVMYVDQFTNLLEETLENTMYAGYTEQFAVDDGSNVMHTLIALVPLGIAFAGRHIIANINNARANIMINISLMGVAISLLANYTSGILIGRMPIYFTIFNYILLPWLFKNVFTKESKILMRIVCLGGYAAYALYYMYNAWGSAGMPYISDVLHINTWH